jgi:hypothetical protein
MCLFSLLVLRVQDSKQFGWEINGDINYNWKKLLENKVGDTTFWLSASVFRRVETRMITVLLSCRLKKL